MHVLSICPSLPWLTLACWDCVPCYGGLLMAPTKSKPIYFTSFILLQPKFCFNFYFTFFLCTNTTADCTVLVQHLQ
jgi:hypothetical protein